MAPIQSLKKIKRNITVSIKKKVFLEICKYFNEDEWIKTHLDLDLDEIENSNTDKIEITVAKLRKLSEYIKVPVSAFFSSPTFNKIYD